MPYTSHLTIVNLIDPLDFSDRNLQSQAIQAAGQIWVSGQIPADAQGNLIGGSIADQTKACCEALKNILEDAGSDITRTVKVSYLQRIRSQ